MSEAPNFQIEDLDGTELQEIQESEVQEQVSEYRIAFDQDKNLIGDKELIFDSPKLGGQISAWVDDILKEHGYEYAEGGPAYFLAELARNVVEWARTAGDVKISIDEDKFSATITDSGAGIEQPARIIKSKPGHGLSSLLDYADELTVESLGKKFVKKGKRLVSAGTSDINEGTRITFTKQLG